MRLDTASKKLSLQNSLDKSCNADENIEKQEHPEKNILVNYISDISALVNEDGNSKIPKKKLGVILK